MTRLRWTDRPHDTGIDRGIFFDADGRGHAWNGLVSVRESSTADPIKSYFDGEMIRSDLGREELTMSLEAFTYPKEFSPYDGSLSYLNGQRRKFFGLSYRTQNEIHLVYNAYVSPYGEEVETVSDLVEGENFSWDINTVPIVVPGGRRSSHIVVRPSEADPDSVVELENIIYGTEESPSRLPKIEELISVFDNDRVFIVTDHLNGIWTAYGPEDMIEMMDSTTFEIDSDSVVYVDAETYTIDSL